MTDIVVPDTSFLINVKKLDALQYLCKVFSTIIITPEVWRESFQFQSQLCKLECIKIVKISLEEQEEVDSLHREFTTHYPGKHLGEIEALVIANFRSLFLVLSDNFAPWFIRKNNSKYFETKIYRGTYYFARLIELGIVKSDFLNKLSGTYSKKDIKRISERLK